MKKLFSILLFGLLLMAAPSCEELGGLLSPDDEQTEQPDDGQEDETPVFEIDGEGVVVVDAAGGRVEITVTTNLEYSIEIPAEASDWITLDETRAVRTETVALTVAKNEGAEGRSAVVSLLDGDGAELFSVTIKQRGAEEENPDTDKSLDQMECAPNEILYISADGLPLTLGSEEGFGGSLTHNTYENGVGRLTFDTDVVAIPDYAFKDCASMQHIKLPDGVASIGVRAFESCVGLTSITIPDSVTSIGEMAFVACFSLTSATIPNSVTSIGEGAFYNCTGLTSVTIPNSVASTGNWVFAYCSSLTNVTIPDGVAEIGSYAFCSCDNLTSISIPDSVTTIGERAFEGCFSLTSITIPNSVMSIGDYAFLYCTGELTVNCNIPDGRLVSLPEGNTISSAFASSDFSKIVIGEGVTSIGYGSFAFCDNLTSVTIPESVTEIGTYAFYGCTGELMINCNIPNDWGENSVFAGSAFSKIVIGEGVTSIGDYAFMACDSLTTIEIPDSVTSIGTQAFSYCSNLTSITIPNSVTSIRLGTFLECTSLTSVIIPDGVTSIEYSAFADCSSLTSITIPESVTEVGESVFLRCQSMEAFYGKFASSDNRCLVVDGELNSFAPAGLTEYTIPSGVTSIGSSAFQGCNGLTSITIPESVTSIGSYAFARCNGLTSVFIPESVNSIGELAFYGCTGELTVNCNIPDGYYEYDYENDTITIHSAFAGSSFTKVVIGEGVTHIGDWAFSGCDGLTSIVIPESITSIGKYAFDNCYRLTSVTIPESVTSIGEGAFYACNDLTSVYCKPTTPPTAGYAVFWGNASDRKIYVPAASVEAYKSDADWSEYADAIVGYNF